MSKPEFFVGIDVAQPHLDVAIAGEDAVWRVSYDAAGLTELWARLAAAGATQVLCWKPPASWRLERGHGSERRRPCRGGSQPAPGPGFRPCHCANWPTQTRFEAPEALFNPIRGSASSRGLGLCTDRRVGQQYPIWLAT